MTGKTVLSRSTIIFIAMLGLLSGSVLSAEIPGGCPAKDAARGIIMTPDSGCYTGTDPGRGIRPGERAEDSPAGVSPESLSGSYVAFDPAGGDACWMPGSVHNLAFTAQSYTTDWEYVYNIWLKFPADWTVTNVTIAGTPSCTGGGTWGTLSWSNIAPNEINISHSRYQATTDSCTATYLVTVTTGAAVPNALVSWFWDGDGYNAAPHNPCSSDSYTPSGQNACDQAVNPQASIPVCSLTGVVLSAVPVAQEACPGETLTYPFTLYNYTGASATYNVSVTGNSWTVGAPATVGPVPDSGSVIFNVTHTIDPGAADGASDTPTVTVTDQVNAANTDSQAVTTTADTEGSWITVIGSAPTWSANGYPCRGCTARNGSGQWNTYIIGDTTSFSGFWAYNHATNTWSQPAPSGLPANRWSPGWAYDAATNLCYMTGGANAPGGGTYNTAYVFDPVANSFTALPGFTTARDFHNSWVGTIDGTKYLCIGGGVNAASAFFSSTQCFNIGTGTWQAENALMPAYSFGARWGAAEGLIVAPTGNQFWVAAGADSSGTLTSTAYYFDDADNAWHAAGSIPTPVYRTNGAVIDQDFYVIGGSTGGFTPSALVQRYQTGVWSALENMPHSRMDLVTGVGESGYLWVVDGYGTGSTPVDYLAPCATAGCPTITIAPATLPDPVVGVVYNQTVTASGGTAPYTYAVTIGTLPPGLTLDPATGVVSGTPTAGGSYTFTITATDSADCTGTISYTLTLSYGWNMSVYDDAGRSYACINSDTGYYEWHALAGFGAGVYMGRSNVSFVSNIYYFQSGMPSGMNLKVSLTTNKASGYCFMPPMRERSICIDSDITDNPACP